MLLLHAHLKRRDILENYLNFKFLQITHNFSFNLNDFRYLSHKFSSFSDLKTGSELTAVDSSLLIHDTVYSRV